MSEEELIKALKGMDKKRVEELEPNSRKLFDAIMEIANSRDRLLEENKQLKKEIKEYQEELSKADSITQSCIFDGAKESAISYRECLNELNKYKSLYENEKEHVDTLKRIINKTIEEIYNLLDDCDSVIGNKESSIVSKNQLMIMQREKLTKILDLLKEIK